jgi:hypothetical protein
LYGQKFRDKVTKKVPEKTRAQTTEEHEELVKQELRIQRDRIIAVSLIKRSGKRFGTLRDELANAFALGEDKYPKDPTSALGVLNTYVRPGGGSGNDHRNHTFLQNDGGGG